MAGLITAPRWLCRSVESRGATSGHVFAPDMIPVSRHLIWHSRIRRNHSRRKIAFRLQPVAALGNLAGENIVPAGTNGDPCLTDCRK